MASLTKFEVSQAETTWFLDDHFHDPSAECSVHLGGQSDVVGNGQVFGVNVVQVRCKFNSWKSEMEIWDQLSPPRPNFQTFWEPLGKTILKETRKV